MSKGKGKKAAAKDKKPTEEAQAQGGGGFTPKQYHVEWIPQSKIIPYAKNARKNDQTVPYLVNAIRRFGFRVPLVIDSRNIIVCGHTRLKAAEIVGTKLLPKLPCVRAEDLTDAQIKAFRIADNKIQELSSWDFDTLVEEMKKLGDEFGEGLIDFGFAENGAEINPDQFFDPEGEQGKAPKHYRIVCPSCGKRIVVEG